MTALDLLREWVAIPSINPAYPAPADWTGEARLASHLAAHLERMGGDVRLLDALPGRPNVLARFAPPGPTRRVIVLAPHLDTVGADGMTVPPFDPVIHDGRLYGRGACDTKGPMAAAVAALARWRGTPAWRASQTEWVVAATADEESGGAGADRYCRDGLRADFAVALEPTGRRVVHALKGKLRVDLTVTGKSCHASCPADGINAAYKSIPVLRLCEQLCADWMRRRHPVLGYASLNLGLLQAGTGLNIVPDRCRMGLDIRTHPDFTNAEALAELKAALAREAPDCACRTLLEGPPMLTDPTHPLAAALAAESAGFGVENWFSDANVFSAAGIPSVAFGPGSIAQAHTADEWIGLEDLAEGEAALYRFMERIG